MKQIGVIGGLGPLASAYYLELLTSMTKAERDQDHIDVYMYSCPKIPDRTSYILDPEHCESPMPRMIEVCKMLERDGVSIITIPCITAHFFHKQLEENCGVYIINAINETVKYLMAHHVHKVGIMATDGTIQTKLFQNKIEVAGMTAIVPDQVHQQKVMDIIYKQVKRGKPVEKDLVCDIEAYLKANGAEVILLGCTELSIAKREFQLGSGFLDVLEVLASCAVQECGELKEEYRELITK